MAPVGTISTAALLAFSLLAATAYQARAAEPLTVVPYHIDRSGWLVVDVTLNGEGSHPFIIDTGATRSVVFATLAALKAFPGTDAPPHRVIGVASDGFFPTYQVGEMAIGSAALVPLVTVVLDDWRIGPDAPQGVIGLDFLVRYRVVFDADAMTMRLYAPTGEVPAYTGRWRAVDLKRSNFGLNSGDLFLLEATVERNALEFMLDLGAAATIVNTRAVGGSADGMAPAVGALQPRSPGRVTDSLDRTVDASQVLVQRVQVNKSSWRNQSIVVHDAAVFEELGRAREPFGLFGADLLAERSFMLDLANDTLLIGEPSRRQARQRPVTTEPRDVLCIAAGACR
jgi:predicted aspartyl protease